MSTKRNVPPAVCFYFQVHQPYRLNDLRITDIGDVGPAGYFDATKNHAIFRKVAKKCYLPANALMLTLLRDHPDFRIAYSLSGVFLDQCREYGQDVLDSFRSLAKTGQVEFLAETYYHSLSSLFSLGEFCEQVKRHANTIEELFGERPTMFRNTELVYSNEIAEIVRLLGFKGMLAEGADHLLKGREATTVYRPPRFSLPAESKRTIARYRIHPRAISSMKVLLKHYRLSDDIAFRFSNRTWPGYPLKSETFVSWVRENRGFTTNLFMDYETFGEHQWADTGIFQFLAALPGELKRKGIPTRTPSETIAAWARRSCPILDAHIPYSWADSERDLSAWRGNPLQEAALANIYSLESQVKASGDAFLLDTWRRLQTSDHFYYLCTKYWNDGDVHRYFSPYESPYEAYRRYSHAVEDLRLVLEKAQSEKCVVGSGKCVERTTKQFRLNHKIAQSIPPSTH